MTLDQGKAYKLWEAMGAAGFTLGEIETTIKTMVGVQEQKPPRKKWTRTNENWKTHLEVQQDRFNRMADLYKAGETMEEIGERFSLTRERVRQILKKGGIVRKDGGGTVKAAVRKHLAYNLHLERKDNRMLKYYGCTSEEMETLNEGKKISAKGSLAVAYRSQMRHAEYLHIDWQFTFPSWVAAWKSSGKLEQRGRTADSYVMGRKGDIGPYSPDNVIFITLRQNSSDSQTKLCDGHKVLSRDELGLTPKVRQAYDLFIAGATAVDIAKAMGISYGTAYGHFTAARRKHEEIMASKST